jgi:hypothetical protein
MSKDVTEHSRTLSTISLKDNEYNEPSSNITSSCPLLPSYNPKCCDSKQNQLQIINHLPQSVQLKLLQVVQKHQRNLFDNCLNQYGCKDPTVRESLWNTMAKSLSNNCDKSYCCDFDCEKYLQSLDQVLRLKLAIYLYKNMENKFNDCLSMYHELYNTKKRHKLYKHVKNKLKKHHISCSDTCTSDNSNHSNNYYKSLKHVTVNDTITISELKQRREDKLNRLRRDKSHNGNIDNLSRQKQLYNGHQRHSVPNISVSKLNDIKDEKRKRRWSLINLFGFNNKASPNKKHKCKCLVSEFKHKKSSVRKLRSPAKCFLDQVTTTPSVTITPSNSLSSLDQIENEKHHTSHPILWSRSGSECSSNQVSSQSSINESQSVIEIH